MADKSIFQLTTQSTFADEDRLVIGNYANNDARAITGAAMVAQLTALADGHGGISSITAVESTADAGTNVITVTMADETTASFNVKNGSKGSTGLQTRVWIRYSHVQPTQNSDMGTSPDEWIGIATNTSSSAPSSYTSYTWYKYKGETGATGTAAAITSQAVEYQAGASGTTVPTSAWSSSVPSVSQGSYLWTRTTLTYNDGTTVTSYSVGRMGIDGSGAVSTINNIGVDTGTTNVTLTGGDIPIASTPTANVAVATDASGKLVASSISATELNMLSGASSNIQTQIGTLNTTVGTKATKTILTGTIEAADWTGSDPYTNDVTVTGLLTTDTPIMDLVASSTFATAQAEIADYGYIYKATCSAADTLTVYATQAPTNDLSIQLVCVR